MEKYQQLMNIIRSLPSLDSYYYVIRNYYSYRDKGVCIIENLLRTLLVKIAPFLDIEIDDNKRPISVINYGMCDFTTSDSLKKFRKKHDGCYLLIENGTVVSRNSFYDYDNDSIVDEIEKIFSKAGWDTFVFDTYAYEGMYDREDVSYSHLSDEDKLEILSEIEDDAFELSGEPLGNFISKLSVTDFLGDLGLSGFLDEKAILHPEVEIIKELCAMDYDLGRPIFFIKNEFLPKYLAFEAQFKTCMSSSLKELFSDLHTLIDILNYGFSMGTSYSFDSELGYYWMYVFSDSDTNSYNGVSMGDALSIYPHMFLVPAAMELLIQKLDDTIAEQEVTT